MFRQLFHRAAHKAAARHTGSGGLLDFRYGFALLRDRGVPAGLKLLALASGGVLTAALVALEVPLEGLLGFFVPVLGLAADMMVDGLEVVVLPVIFACLFLPRLVTRRMAPARVQAPPLPQRTR